LPINWENLIKAKRIYRVQAMDYGKLWVVHEVVAIGPKEDQEHYSREKFFERIY